MDKNLVLEITECDGFHQAYLNDLRISKNKPLSESKTVLKLNLSHDFLLEALSAALGGKIIVDLSGD